MLLNVADRITRLIVERLEIPIPDDFDQSTPLFKGGLGLDSIGRPA